MQAYRNTVPVPRHWSQKRKFLQGKRGIEKPAFQLPDFIEATGISEMRKAYQEKVCWTLLLSRVCRVTTSSHSTCCFSEMRLLGFAGYAGFSTKALCCSLMLMHVVQEDAKKLKSKQRSKMQPKMGKLGMDYQMMHEAFFKYQSKPHLTRIGDLYYEGKEFEARVRGPSSLGCLQLMPNCCHARPCSSLSMTAVTG